jgi:hypothetical protein
LEAQPNAILRLAWRLLDHKHIRRHFEALVTRRSSRVTKENFMSRIRLKFLALIAIVTCAVLSWVNPASATPFCSSFDGQSLSMLALSSGNPTGTTCEIGDLTYSFGTVNSAILTLNSGGSVTGETNGPSASNFIFNALSNGFSLSYAGGLAVNASTPGQGTNLIFQLNYGVSDSDGVLLSADVGGGTLASTPTTTGTGTNQDIAQYNTAVCDNVACSGNFIQGEAQSENGVSSAYQRELGNPVFEPFSSANINEGAAVIQLEDFYLGSASWDGSATSFTIDTSTPSNVPEPSTTSLLIGGMLGAALLRRRRRERISV